MAGRPTRAALTRDGFHLACLVVAAPVFLPFYLLGRLAQIIKKK